MLRDDAIAMVAARVGNRTDLTETIRLEMALVITTKLEENPVLLPWFLLITNPGLSTFGLGLETINLPADFIMESEERALQIYDDSAAKWKTLKKMPYGEMDAKFADTAPGFTQAYSLDGTQIKVRPFPPAGVFYTYQSRHYRHDPNTLAANIETLWLKYAPDLVIAATAQAVANGVIHDHALGQTFDSQIIAAWQRLKVLNEAREHANQTYEMGED